MGQADTHVGVSAAVADPVTQCLRTSTNSHCTAHMMPAGCTLLYLRWSCMLTVEIFTEVISALTCYVVGTSLATSSQAPCQTLGATSTTSHTCKSAAARASALWPTSSPRHTSCCSCAELPALHAWPHQRYVPFVVICISICLSICLQDTRSSACLQVHARQPGAVLQGQQLLQQNELISGRLASPAPRVSATLTVACCRVHDGQCLTCQATHVRYGYHG